MAGTSLEDAEILRWSEYLDAAQRGARPVEPLTGQLPGLTVEDGYRVQASLVSLREKRGEAVVGAKAGLTSVAKQRQMGVEEPVFGWLTDAMEIDPGAGVPMAGLIHPRVEPEIAFILGSPLSGTSVTAEEVRSATAAVCCGLELLDSRFVDFRFSLPDVVADNTSAAGFLRGPSNPLPGHALAGERVELRVDGEVVASATGDAVLGDPAEAVARLASFLGRSGQRLEPGWIILSGGLTDAVHIREGATLEVVSDSIGSLCTRVLAR